MLTGERPEPLQSLDFYKDKVLYDVISGNLFDGDKSFAFVGFESEITVQNRYSNLLRVSNNHHYSLL